MEMDKAVCNCMSVTVGDLKAAINNGASTFKVQETYRSFYNLC